MSFVRFVDALHVERYLNPAHVMCVTTQGNPEHGWGVRARVFMSDGTELVTEYMAHGALLQEIGPLLNGQAPR